MLGLCVIVVKLMAFELCDTPPRPDQLAVSNPKDRIKDHADALNRQLRYWSDEGLTALAEGKDGMLAIARSLNDELLRAAQNHRREISGVVLSRRARENNRRRALGALSMAVLVRALLSSGEEVELADVQ